MITKTLLACLAVATGGLFLGEPPQDKAASGAAKEFRIDPVHSTVVFRVIHLKAGPFWGRFNSISGSFKIDAENLADSFVRCEIDAESVDSNNERRDRHLKSQDFFNVKEHPKITFASTKIEKDGDHYEITGDLTLRGVKKSVTAKVEHIGTAEVSPRFGLRSGYEATLVVDRTEFGMDFMADGGLSKQVKVIIGVEGMLPRGDRR